MTTLAITEAMTSINEAESRFNLRREDDLQFFPEWFETLPELTPSEAGEMDRVHRNLCLPMRQQSVRQVWKL